MAQPELNEWHWKIAAVSRTDQETYRDVATYTGRHHSLMQSDSIPQEQEGLHKYKGFVTNECNPCKCRVKHHSHIHLHKWKRETALSINNGKTLNLSSVVTTCFASSLCSSSISPYAMQHCINKWFIKQCNFEVKFTVKCALFGHWHWAY